MNTFFTIEKSDISEQYRKIRATKERELTERKEELFRKCPELLQIEQKIFSVNADCMRRILTASPDQAAALKKERNRELDALKKKRSELLASLGTDESALEPEYECPICQDQGVIDGQRCECFRKKYLSQLYRQSTLESILKRENFDTFRSDYYSNDPVGENVSPRRNIEVLERRARAFADAFPKSKKSFLFYGETGLGKTFLTNCISKALMDKGYTVLYLSSNDLFSDILGPYLMSGTDEQKALLRPVYELIFDADLLVIDDLGTELTNTFTTSCLFEIVNKRGRDERSTIISTNFSLQQLRDRYQERIVSRIAEQYEMCRFYGQDIRSLKKAQELLQRNK
ncbi:MAG: ATP-binding protein [Eubacterium sp.]|nr:ATP-binding protein [Eubacterium sp.]